MPGKLGMTTTIRMSVLKNQATQLIWYGRLETTKARAKELQSYVEKIITTAINSYEDTIETTVTTKDAKGKDVTKKVIKDGPKKLAARRRVMAKLHDIPYDKTKGESKAEPVHDNIVAEKKTQNIYEALGRNPDGTRKL